MASQELDFKTLDFELSRVEGSTILDSKTRQAVKDAAYILREVRTMIGAEATDSASSILAKLNELVRAGYGHP